jgi:hypothetical protein
LFDNVFQCLKREKSAENVYQTCPIISFVFLGLSVMPGNNSILPYVSTIFHTLFSTLLIPHEESYYSFPSKVRT